MAISDPKKSWIDRLLTRRYMVSAAIVAAILAIGGYGYWRFRTIGTVVLFMRIGQYDPGEILLRTLSPDNDILLIGPVNSSDGNRISLGGAEPVPSGVVYRFTPGVDGLEASGLDEWRQASGTITYKYFDRDRSIAPLGFEGKSLTFGDTPLATAGSYNLDIDISPDRKYVNVVSANAPRSKGSVFWAIGGGGGYPRGPFYHEVFDRITGAKIGPTYTLAPPGELVTLSYCWEAQGKYVVYHDMFGRFLWVVPGPSLTNIDARSNQASTASSTNVEKSHD